MIQDINPHKYNITYQNYKAGKEDFICFINEREILIKLVDNKIHLPKLKDFDEELNTIYLISIDDKRFFLSLDDPKGLNDYQYINMKDLMLLEEKWMAYACLVAISISDWYLNNIYCSKCGNKNVLDEKERMLKCPSCHKQVYPRINPCVIVGIIDKDEIVLTRSINHEYVNSGLVSGFCEYGETLEETIIREVKEEVGLNVKNIRYYKSQPWPRTDALLMGFYCELDGNKTIVRQESELSEAIWVNKKDITERKNLNSLTAEMINNFKFNM